MNSAFALAPIVWFTLGGPLFGQLKIGEVDPLTGGVSQFGVSCHHGIELALGQVNAAGGVNGQNLELISEDNQSRPGQSATAVHKLITQDHVQAILGDATSSATLESAPIAQQAKVPMVTPSGTNPRITEVGNEIFRVCFLDEFQGRVMAHFAHDKLKLAKIAVLTDVRQDYSVDLARFFKDEFIKLGGNIVREQSYSTGDTDFRAQVTALRAVKPDAIYIPGYYAEVALALKQARQFGLNVPVLGCDGWANQALLSVAGKAVENTYFTNHFSPDDPAPIVRAFVDAYQSKFGQPPDTFAALGYDAALIVVDAFRRAGSERPEGLRDALAATTRYAGVTGEITFDARRNASKPALVITVKDGKFEVAGKVTP
ncbi:MAG TPA: ABC transporter substrate-binding protein [Chthoniobacterales bacterium]